MNKNNNKSSNNNNPYLKNNDKNNNLIDLSLNFHRIFDNSLNFLNIKKNTLHNDVEKTIDGGLRVQLKVRFAVRRGSALPDGLRGVGRPRAPHGAPENPEPAPFFFLRFWQN